jgi:phage terminase large subunit-like protein
MQTQESSENLLIGNLVKREWLRSYGPDDVPRRFMRVIQSWDTAAKNSELNDYSVCTTWASSERVIT